MCSSDLNLPRPKVLAHGHAKNQTHRNLASDYSDRLLGDRMFVLEDAGYPIVFTVHEKIVVEQSDIPRDTIERIMSERPPWAVRLGVPVKAKAWVGKRYRK